jgi:hypothetical protein
MAERFVRGYVVSSELLKGLVGSGFPVKGSLTRRSESREEIEETLDGDGWVISIEQALGHLSSGKLDPDLAYVYRRVTELLLVAFAQRLPGEIDLALTYYLPNDSFGRWNPVLKAMGCSRTARHWAADNFPFPWRRRPRGVDTDWPALTLIRSGELEALAAELAAPPRSVADELLRPDLDGSTEELVVEARTELERGLRRLQSWIARAAAPQAKARPALAPSGNDLLLWMDGDQ